MGIVKERKLQIRIEKSWNITKKTVDFKWEFFDVEKGLEILNYMEIISVRQENRSTDFLEEKWLNFWKKYNTILIIAGKDCCCTVPKRNWHIITNTFFKIFYLFRLFWRCCTVPKRNWHLLLNCIPFVLLFCCTVPKRNWHVHSDCTSRVFLDGLQQVVPYLRGIDTV